MGSLVPALLFVTGAYTVVWTALALLAKGAESTGRWQSPKRQRIPLEGDLERVVHLG